MHPVWSVVYGNSTFRGIEHPTGTDTLCERLRGRHSTTQASCLRCFGDGARTHALS